MLVSVPQQHRGFRPFREFRDSAEILLHGTGTVYSEICLPVESRLLLRQENLGATGLSIRIMVILFLALERRVSGLIMGMVLIMLIIIVLVRKTVGGTIEPAS